MEEKFFTPEQIAEKFQVTKNAVYNWVARGQLKGIKIGRSLRISQSALDDFIEIKGNGDQETK